jgi:hypothetical protein
MSAYLVSGPSGSGKSTVGRVLQQRGFRVIETDFEDGLSGWFDNVSKSKITEMPKQPYTPEWVASHSWLWDNKRMKELLDSVGPEPVFFCGGAYNEKNFFGSFVLRFGLCADGVLITKRLQSREPQRYPDESTELKGQIEWNGKFRDYCQTTGTIVIESSESPDRVADNILSHVK